MRHPYIFLLIFLWGFVLGKEILLKDDFEGERISSIWRLEIGEGESFARLEPRGERQCLHLFGDHTATSIQSQGSIPNIAYTLEYDFFQPAEEVGGYQAVVHHSRPQGYSYWWLEYGPQRFFLYTLAGGIWFNRWQVWGIPENRWLHIQICNTPNSVRVRIYDETGGNLLGESPPIPHDDGAPSPLSFSAVGDQRGVWGMKIDNVQLNITPIPERDDYIQRKTLLDITRSTLMSEETLKVWKEAKATFLGLESAFEKISAVSPSDWQAYVEANESFDALLQKSGERYYKEVVSQVVKEKNGWIMLDLWEHFNTDALNLGIELPFTQPIVEVQGIPFLVQPFGRNCLWQDIPSRSRYSITLNSQAKLIALLLVPQYDEELYGHDDSLIDVLGVELLYIDGFRERVFPVPIGWQSLLPYEIGNPPMPNKKLNPYVIQPSHPAPISQIAFQDGAIQAGWALFALSYQPGLPTPIGAISLKTRSFRIKPSPPAIFQTEEGLILENSCFRLIFDKERGVLKEFRSPLIGNLISKENPSPFFAIQANEGRLVYSDEFKMGNFSFEKRGEGAILRLSYTMGDIQELSVNVNIEAGKEGVMKWQAILKNSSSQPLKVRLVFPLLDGLNLGERVGWYFPQRGGAVSELPIEGLASYGGMAWLQLLDVYRPQGGGIYLRSDDTKGTYKIFSLRYSPDETKSPRRVKDIPEPAHSIDPWRVKMGIHLSIQYLPYEIPPQGSWSPPLATLCLHQGDWRQALADYRSWLKSWWKQARACPERYKYGFYALVGGAPADEQKGEEFGSYDWWHLSPFWTIDYPDELKSELEELKKQAGRAKGWGQAVGVYIEGMVLEKKRKIAKEKGEEWAMMDDKGRYYEYYSTESNPVWNICPAVKEWQRWDAETYAEIARRVPLCAMYVDSTGSRWAEVCYNPAHHHPTPGIWVQGCGELFETIRQKVMKVNPQIAIHSEEPGSDYMAVHEDGSWSHTLWTNLSGDIEYNPAGLNYFRFVLPQFKMYEIPSYRHALWRCKLAFFNGEGLWTSQPDALRRELFIRWMPTLRENADVFLSEDVEPALPILSPPLYINRFSKGEQTIYTIYNAGLRTQVAKLRIPLPQSGHIFDLLKLEELRFQKKGKEALIDISVDPHDVLCLLVAPKLMEVKAKGEKLFVKLAKGKIEAKELWIAKIDEEGVRKDIQRFPLKETEFIIDLKKYYTETKGRFLLRLPLPHLTQDIFLAELR